MRSDSGTQGRITLEELVAWNRPLEGGGNVQGLSQGYNLSTLWRVSMAIVVGRVVRCRDAHWSKVTTSRAFDAERWRSRST